MKIMLLISLLFFATIAWACCMAAATADEQAEELYQDYLKWKHKREPANNREEKMKREEGVFLSTEEMSKGIATTFIEGAVAGIASVHASMDVLKSGIEKEEISYEEVWGILSGTIQKSIIRWREEIKEMEEVNGRNKN